MHELLIGVLACICLTLEFVPPGRCGEDLLACSDSAPQEGPQPGCPPACLCSVSGPEPLSPSVTINSPCSPPRGPLRFDALLFADRQETRG